MPLSLAISAWLGAYVAEYVPAIIRTSVDTDIWLLDHQVVGFIVGELWFLTYAICSGLLVALGTWLLLRYDTPPTSIASRHFQYTFVLYLVLASAIVLYARCVNECEGLVLGAFRSWAHAAVGGILANVLVLRRAKARFVAA
jgi:hypothetical protein